MALLRKHGKFLGRSHKPEGIQIVSANGSRLRDARGRSLIDFQCGWGVGNLGWNHPVVLERVRKFDGPSYKRCTDRGLLLYEEEEDLVLMPPVIVDEPTVDKAMTILAEAARV